MARTVEVMARMALAYELGTSPDGEFLSITFEHEDGESVIGIPGKALYGFVEKLLEADAELRRRRREPAEH